MINTLLKWYVIGVFALTSVMYVTVKVLDFKDMDKSLSECISMYITCDQKEPVCE